MAIRGVRLLVATLAIAATAGCLGGSDTEAGDAADRLAAALAEPDAGALRELVAAGNRATRTDLLTDAVVADNAFAGASVDVEDDLDRYNGYGTFTLTSDDAPGVELRIDQRLTEARTPGGLESVSVRADRPLTTLRVGDHDVLIDPAVEPTDGPQRFYLPPGRWTLDLPANRFASVEPQTVELLDDRRPDDVTLRSTLTAAGRDEAVRQAEAYVAACGRSTKDPEPGCGGDLTLCVGQDTARTVTFSPAPRWRVGDDLRLTHQAGVRRTVTTTCTERDSGTVAERTTRSGPADLSGTVVLTDDGLDVDLR